MLCTEGNELHFEKRQNDFKKIHTSVELDYDTFHEGYNNLLILLQIA